MRSRFSDFFVLLSSVRRPGTVQNGSNMFNFAELGIENTGVESKPISVVVGAELSSVELLLL